MSKDREKVWGITLVGGGGETVIDNRDVMQCYFIEDIYSWCKCGKLTLIDARGIWEFIPLAGDETITILYRSMIVPGEWEERTYTFKVYKVGEIGDVSPETAGTRERATKYSLEIFFVEEEFFKLHMPHYSRAWVDFLYYDIVKEMSDMYLGLNEFVWDEDAGEMIEFFTTNLKTPADNIRWLMERMKGAGSGESGYLYYSNTEVSEKSWNIVTLETLLADGELLDPPGEGLYFIGGAANHFAINNVMNAVISHIDKTSIDTMTLCNYLGYDIYRKYQIKKEFDYFMSKDHYTMLGDFTLFNGDDLLSHVKKPMEVLTGESGDKHMKLECLLENMYFGEWIRAYCLQQLVTLTVRGHCLRWAGGHVELNWLSANTDERFNKNMMGRYLVKSITHQFSGVSRPQYIQKMVLIKNGYNDTDAELTPAGKTNVTDTRQDSDTTTAVIQPSSKSAGNV